MRKIFLFMAMVALLLAITLSASAATKLPKYALVTSGEQVALSEKTGYLFRDDSVLMIPLEAVLDQMNIDYQVDAARTNISITHPDDKVVKLRVGSAVMKVGGVNEILRTKTARQDGKLITADVRVLKALTLSFTHYKASAETRGKGYPAGALVVAAIGGDLTLPPASKPTDILPEALKEAAQSANQIIGVKYQGGSRAKVTYYKKSGAGLWSAQFSADGYVGKSGIDKEKEGDKKTPTGTFNLTQPFGILANPGVKMGKYIKVTSSHYWSGSSDPAYYNRLVDTRQEPAYVPTSNDEKLINYKGVYNYAIALDYNKDRVVGKGSAIFLHCTGTNKYTGGCIAIPQAVMKSLMIALNPGAKIVIYR